MNAKHLFVFLPVPALLPAAVSVAADLNTPLTLSKGFRGLKRGENHVTFQHPGQMDADCDLCSACIPEQTRGG